MAGSPARRAFLSEMPPAEAGTPVAETFVEESCAMLEPHSVRGCRWAEPTLLQDTPLWIASERFPWTCNVDGRPERVEDASSCRACVLWMPRRAEPQSRPPQPDAPAPCGCSLCRARDRGLATLESK
jgi:hypothetical protein